MAMIKDKRASSQGLVLVIDDSHDSLSGPCFLIPVEHVQTIYGGSNSLWGGIAKFPGRIPKEQIIQGLKKAGQFIGQHYDDILGVINKLRSKKEKNEATTPPLIISPPLVISPPPTSSRFPHNTLIQFLKGESKIALEIPLPLALAGVSIFFGIGFVYLVMSNISNVSMFSKGDHQADMFSKVTKSKRLAAIYLNLAKTESQFIDRLVNDTFGKIGDESGSCEIFRTVMSTATEKPFFLCFSTKNNFYIAFRGCGIRLVGGAVINDEISAINLGSIPSGNYRIGNFLTENLNLKFLVMGSSVLLELLSRQEIVECVSLAKDQDNATKIANAALEKNPDRDIDELHVAVMFLM